MERLHSTRTIKKYCEREDHTAQRKDYNQAKPSSTKLLHSHRESILCEEETTTLPHSKTWVRETWKLGLGVKWQEVTGSPPTQKPTLSRMKKILVCIPQVRARIVCGCIDHYPVEAVLANSRRNAKDWERTAPPHNSRPRYPLLIPCLNAHGWRKPHLLTLTTNNN